MRTLLNVVNISPAKRYVVPKFLEMLKACVAGVPGTDVHLYTDQGDLARMLVKSPITVELVPPMSTSWQDDMTLVGRQRGMDRAIEGDYDKLVWQGIDCLYDHPADFPALLEQSRHLRVVGALTAGRDRPDYAVCRRWTDLETGEHDDVPEHALRTGTLVSCGFPGADALVIDSDLFRQRLEHESYVPWYEQGSLNGLCCEEFWCLRMAREGVPVYCATSIRPWHVHESGLAARWPGETRQMEELSW